jgi:hypothetical protein
MVRGIIVYFLLVFCLLTKDGISLAFDVLVEKNPISLEMNFEDSFEEDGCNDFFANEDFGLDLDQNNIDGFADKSINDQYKLSTLHVLLEQESPPPRTA